MNFTSMGGLSDLCLCMFDRQLSTVLFSSLGVSTFLKPFSDQVFTCYQGEIVDGLEGSGLQEGDQFVLHEFVRTKMNSRLS